MVRNWLGWALLALLLIDLLIAATVHRSSADGTAAGEATALMQAESLARDFDLAYTRADFDRMLLRWRADPADLALASGSQGRRIAFDRPFPYALWLAPFVALWPKAGAAVANWLLLTLASLLAAFALRTVARGWEAWWIAAMVFFSATFAFVVPATGEVFLLAVTVAGFSVLIGPPRPWSRGFFAGALLAIPLATDWLYGLLLAAAWWVPADGRPAVRRALAAGTAAMLAVIVVVHWLAGGGLLQAGDAFRFTAATGFPLVDFPAAEWSSAVRHFEGHAAGSGFSRDPELRLWSAVDLLLGRAIGLVPYFPCLLLLLAGGSTRGFRRPMVIAAAAWLVAVVAVRPFDVAGPVGFANPLFLPFCGGLWLVFDPRRRPARRVAGAAAAALVAALFLSGLWRDPGIAWDRRDGESHGHLTAAARRWLPYETSQRWRLEGAVAENGGLEVQTVGDSAWVEARHRRLVLAGGAAEVVIRARRPLTAIRLDFEEPAAAHLRVRGGKIDPVADPLLRETASILVPSGLRRRHASWWSPRRSFLYRVVLEWPPSSAPATLRLSDATER